MSEQTNPKIKPPGVCLPARPPRTNVVSDEKARANQKNAQKSTGPRTEEGKAASSRNPLKHGLLAKSVVVDSPTGAESRIEFDALLADLCNELEPHGLIEQTLVERIATCYWRLNRAQRYETGTVRESLEVAESVDSEIDRVRKKFDEAERSLAGLDRLSILFIKADTDHTADEKNEIHSLLADVRIDELRTAVHEVYGLKLDYDPREMRASLPKLRETLLDQLTKLRKQINSLESQSEMRQSRQHLVGSLPDGMSLLKVIRYETMLDRQIHRALNELRRLRDDRM